MNKIGLLLSALLLSLPVAGWGAEPPLLAHDAAAGTTTIRWMPFENNTRYYNVYRYTDPITRANLYFSERIAARLPPGTASYTFKDNGKDRFYYAVSTCNATGATNTIFTRPQAYAPPPAGASQTLR